ncbi:unnamed protein product, partial [Protopolystoma xenopodis]
MAPTTRSLNNRNSDVQVIATAMLTGQQDDVISEAERLLKELRGEQGGMKKEGDVAAALKLFLDKKYGRLWHVVLVRGSFW